MYDKCNEHGFKEAVCIHTDKVYDSCRDKDCLENLRVYVTAPNQEIIDNAINIKCTKAEIIWVFSDIEPVPFNRGYYSIDLRYFFKITLAVFTGLGKPVIIEGLSTFDKKVILFGSEGNAKIFASKYKEDAFDPQMWKKTNMPHAIVEVVDPIVLGSKLLDVCDKSCLCDEEFDTARIPESVCRVFDDNFVTQGDRKRAFVSIGIFSIIKLERKVQLLIPAYDFCVPQKECVGATDDNPCDLFERIAFPVDEFFPPERSEFTPMPEPEDNSCPPPPDNCDCDRPAPPPRRR